MVAAAAARRIPDDQHGALFEFQGIRRQEGSAQPCVVWDSDADQSDLSLLGGHAAGDGHRLCQLRPHSQPDSYGPPIPAFQRQPLRAGAW